MCCSQTKAPSQGAGEVEGPKALLAEVLGFGMRTRVMVLYEGDCAGGPHAQQAGGAPLAVHQAPVLAAPHGLLQNACAATAHRVRS